MGGWKSIAATVLLAGVAGFGGAWLGARQSGEPVPIMPWTFVQAITTGAFDLQRDQLAQIGVLEERYRVRRAALTDKLQEANIRISTNLRKENGFGPETAKAVDDAEEIVGERQRQTVQYLGAVRKVLNPSQRQLFDRELIEAFSARPL